MTKKSVRSTSTRRPRAAAPTTDLHAAAPTAPSPDGPPAASAPAPVEKTPAKRTPAVKAGEAASAVTAATRKPAASAAAPKKTARKVAPAASGEAPRSTKPTVGAKRPSVARKAEPDAPASPLRVLVVASECAPHVSSGDLGDTVAALVAGLAAQGHDVTCVLPRFAGVLPQATVGELRTIAMGDRSETVTLHRADEGPRVHLVAVEHAGFFARPHLYGADGVDYPDNPRRFAVLTMAACAVADEAAVAFDVIHAFDWQAGLLPVLVRARASAASRTADTALVFTVNAPVFQGCCAGDWLAAFGLDAQFASVDAMEYWGGLSLLKGGINFADVVTVESVERVVIAPGGWGFEGIFAARGEALVPLDLRGDAPAVGARASDVYRRARGAARARATA